MTNNIKLDDAMQMIEELLNSSKAPYVLDAIKNLKSHANNENVGLD